MRVEVVCIGTELLTGRVNTHVAYLGEKLPLVGLSIAREHTVSDDPALMEETFREAWRRSDIVISAGGLGPTFDDITRDVWSNVTGRKLKLHAHLVNAIEEKFRRRNLTMPPMNRRQGLVLTGGEAIQNDHGTAPGQILEVRGKILVLLPGPSRELYPMFEKFVLPRFKRLFPNLHSDQRALNIVGIAESRVDQAVRPLVARSAKWKGYRVTHGILASQSIVTVKFLVEGRDPEGVRSAADSLEEKMRARLKDWVFGSGADTLPGVVGKLLRARKRTVAVAESCTGGLLGKLLTDVAGSSEYFVEGVVTYSNRSKVKRLGVPARVIETKGAVSPETARAMALGLKKTSGADIAVSITGVAGPDGGTPEKPRGHVYIGCAGPKRTVVQEFHFDGDRAWVRHRSALMALDLLRRELLA